MSVKASLVQGARRMGRLLMQPLPRQLLAGEAAAYLVWARVMVARVPVSYWRRDLGRVVAGAIGKPAAVPVQDVVWAVESVGRTLPETFACLPRSIAVAHMLARRGYACRVSIGVLPRAGGPLDAHAWVEHGGKVIIGRLPNLDQYVELTDEQLKPRHG